MEPRKRCLQFTTIIYILILITNFSLLTDAKLSQSVYFKHITKSSIKKTMAISSHNKFILSSEPTNDKVYGIPFSLPPVESLPPFPTSESNPPYCLNPPSPSSTSPTLSPPHSLTPSNPQGSPYNHGPTPPKHGPSPPVVYPPPSARQPPPQQRPQYAVWCVAKPTVPDFMLQEALDYACGTEADCREIQANGKCFQPNTLLSHASYAFNSYWQNKKAGGGSCDFGGTAMLVTTDPSFDDCDFINK